MAKCKVLTGLAVKGLTYGVDARELLNGDERAGNEERLTQLWVLEQLHQSVRPSIVVVVSAFMISINIITSGTQWSRLLSLGTHLLHLGRDVRRPPVELHR